MVDIDAMIDNGSKVEVAVTGPEIYGKTFKPSEVEVIGRQDEFGNWVLLVDPSSVRPAILRMFQRAHVRKSPETKKALSDSR